ncbi:MAG: GumC family protein [Armatimonadota bacterium]
MAAEDTKPRHLELPDYIRILSKRKWFVLIVTIVAALFGGLHAVTTPRMYEATALVLVGQRPQGFFWISGEEANMAPTVAMETYARIAQSSDVAGLAAARLEALPEESRIITTAADIQNALTVGVIEPDLLRIDATCSDRRTAELFANYVARAFVEVNTEYRQTESKMARQFLERQVQEQRAELAAIVDSLAQLARESGFVDVEVEVQAMAADLRTYENQLRDAETALRAAEARMAELEQVRGSEEDYLVEPQPAVSTAWSALEQRLAAARVELETLTAQYTDGHPRVLNARALVQELEDELARTPHLIDLPTLRPNPKAANIDVELKAARVALDEAQARYDAISNIVSRLRQQVRGLPEERQRWQALLDQAEAARSSYLKLQDELRQAKLAEAIKVGNARVVDVAQNARKIEASLLKSLLFAGGLGLFVALALAILLEAMDDTIYSVEDLQRVTDLYLLGIVPLRTDEAGPLVTMTAPKSPPAEAYRTLRSNIRFSLFDRPAKTFLFTSAGTGEGKSVTAANLAIAYAQSGESVILVDTDLRRPIIHRLFEIDTDIGLTNVLVGDAKIEDVLVPTEVPGLRLLPSGPLPPNPAELLESQRMTDFIGQLAEMADLVLFDSPPAVMLTDAGILSSKVDRTILVAESGQVTERAIRDMERLFRHARADLLGVVLNKLRVSGGDYYYYYYYYYYDYAGRSARAEEENGRLPDELANQATHPNSSASSSPGSNKGDSPSPARGDGGGEPQDLSGLNFGAPDDRPPREPTVQ